MRRGAAAIVVLISGLMVITAGQSAALARSAAVASESPAVVLVNQPARSVCAGHRFTVGVWFQQFSGGSRAYRIAISGPRHRLFFLRHGQAPTAHWRFWRVLAGRAGRYHTTYYGHRLGSARWTPYRALTIARRCG
ncbi:MAG TPA: hypothetical protein VLX31_10135 [Streptosporangiaceae bacterium]|nr:hypothetical protein [Streptosporangiaceae bacterium]